MTKSRVSALSNDNAKDLRNGAKESEKAAKGVTNPKEAIKSRFFYKSAKSFSENHHSRRTRGAGVSASKRG